MRKNNEKVCFSLRQGGGPNEQLSCKDRKQDGTLSSHQTHPGQPDSEVGFPMVYRSIERNTGPLESQNQSASTLPTPRIVLGASVSMEDSSLLRQVSASAPLGAELSSSQDNSGNAEPPAFQQERRPGFDNKVEFNESSSLKPKNQNAMRDETSGGVNVRGPADLESGELDVTQTGSDDGASIAEKEVTQSKKSSERATDTFSSQQEGSKGEGAKKKADAAKSGKEHGPPTPGQSTSSRNVNANYQNPRSLSPHESTTQSVAKEKYAQVSTIYIDYCS